MRITWKVLIVWKQNEMLLHIFTTPIIREWLIIFNAFHNGAPGIKTIKNNNNFVKMIHI